MNLPAVAGAWTRSQSPKRIDRDGIFSYMDGAGELYLGYRFDHIDVYEYTAKDRDTIQAEIYWMQTSDDAFGLLSNDWGGEPVSLNDGAGPAAAAGPAPASRALYGAGLLRLWSDTVYARVLATRETPDAREQVLAIGRAIAAGRPASPRPSLLDALPERAGTAYVIRRDRVSFLRSPLVLNSAYYLGTENMLDLSLDCDAVIAPYEAAGGGRRRAGTAGPRPHVLVVRYPEASRARKALERFVTAYLKAQLPVPESRTAVMRIEHGWVGYRLEDRTLGLVFDASDASSANTLLQAIRLSP